MIPDHDFCAVSWSNPDVTDILACDSITDQSHCGSKSYCKWYKGKTVTFNQYASVGQKLGMNFCHPPSTSNWDVIAPHCLTRDS
jgi:hypothetical protein